jgi:hypothetical protein
MQMQTLELLLEVFANIPIVVQRLRALRSRGPKAVIADGFDKTHLLTY